MSFIGILIRVVNTSYFRYAFDGIDANADFLVGWSERESGEKG